MQHVLYIPRVNTIEFGEKKKKIINLMKILTWLDDMMIYRGYITLI